MAEPTQSAAELARCYHDTLVDDVLPFWLPRAVDDAHGGFTIMRDRGGELLDTDKGVWQQCRFTWLLATLHNTLEAKPEWRDAALHGIRFIDTHAFDPADGRMWFHLDQRGRPIRKRRYAFTESFGAIAYAAAARMTGDDTWAQRAIDCLNRFLTHRPEPKCTDTRPMRGLAQPMIALATAQSLRQDIGYDAANRIIDEQIEVIGRDFVKPDIGCVMETVGENGEVLDHFDGRMLNPGHAIEGAWFIMHEGAVRDDRSLVDMGCRMLDWMLERGWDTEYGGIYYFRDVYGKPVQEYWHDMKFWWPHNEAMIATLLAWGLTGDDRYRDWHRKVHGWAFDVFADREHGEWFGYAHRDGRLSVTLKGNLWKGPFHLPRMLLYCSQLLRDREPGARGVFAAEG